GPLQRMARSGLRSIVITHLLQSVPSSLSLLRRDPGVYDSAWVRIPRAIRSKSGSQNSLRADRSIGAQTLRLVFQAGARFVAGIERGENSGEKAARIQLGSGRSRSQEP